MSDSDADLHARLRAVDPAAELPPAEPDDVDHLLRRVVDSDLRETGTRRRNALTWLVAAAAVVVIAAGLTWWFSDDHSQPGVVAQPSSGKTGTAPRTTELTVASAPGRCIMPTADLLANKPLAFAGTVLGITDGVVTIRPTKVYAGDVGDQVTVRGAAAPDTGGVEGDPAFVAGKDYLVAAADGQVVGCGLSGPVGPEIQRLYAQAFPQ
jgi:hypothetical protein